MPSSPSPRGHPWKEVPGLVRALITGHEAIESLGKRDAICAGELLSPLNVLRRLQLRKQPIGGAQMRGSRCRAPLGVSYGGKVQMRPCLLRPVAVLGKRLPGFLEVYRRFGERPAGSLNASQGALGNPDANPILGFPGAG